MPPSAPTGQQPAKAQAPVQAPWPFPVGVLETVNASDYDQTKTMSTGAVQFPDVQVQPDGWTRGIWFDVNAVCTSNTNTVTFNGDAAAGTGAPFSMINTVLFKDTGGEQIFGPFNGYDWMTTNKFGGYHEVGDPRNDYNYSTTTGSATNSGSAHFTLYLPLEISAADSLGDVENRSENSIYRVSLTLEQSSVVYGVSPTNLPAVEITTTQDSYTEPVAAMALSGRPIAEAPPSPGTLQYWKQEDDASIPGSGTHSSLITNGIGNGYRNLIFKLIRTSGTRANGTSDWPTLQELDLGTTRVRNLYKKLWQDKTIRTFGFTAAPNTPDVALGLESGVFVLPFNRDTGMEPGNESRRQYLRTKPGNTLKLRGNYGNAGSLFMTENYVVPRNNDFSQVVR
jgi:hypothetical protein